MSCLRSSGRRFPYQRWCTGDRANPRANIRSRGAERPSSGSHRMAWRGAKSSTISLQHNCFLWLQNSCSFALFSTKPERSIGPDPSNDLGEAQNSFLPQVAWLAYKLQDHHSRSPPWPLPGSRPRMQHDGLELREKPAIAPKDPKGARADRLVEAHCGDEAGRLRAFC